MNHQVIDIFLDRTLIVYYEVLRYPQIEFPYTYKILRLILYYMKVHQITILYHKRILNNK